MEAADKKKRTDASRRALAIGANQKEMEIDGFGKVSDKETHWLVFCF